ncbi:MAG: SDR family NAD(P)-dependent oxidoreductase [Candidatus Omnitrophota bacterium]
MYNLETQPYTGLEVAIIGLAGRFPGAPDIDAFRNNLKNGVESIYVFNDEELDELGVDSQLRDEPNFVRAKGALAQSDCFDAAFFGYTPLEAEIMDPQIRVFHECAWSALENAGYDPGTYDGTIGLYAGAASNVSWMAYSMMSGKSDTLGEYAALTLNNKDYLCTRISYNLNLRGPSFSVQTACSTSLVAIHLACQGILSGECHMALAGGVALSPQYIGYLYQEGMILSPDGHTRTFDKDAGGTLTGEGAGIVVLKSLEDAVADGDHIVAVIRGSAIDNDGSDKIGFTAPSVKGQVAAISAAIRAAQIEPETIGLIETHGTGTKLGDPVEINALKQVFDTEKRNFCAIGSVKTNIGHLDTAAGVAGFIKATLALYHQLLPPSLNFKTPNPDLDLENSPFYVITELKEWKTESYPRRAGVSSFGIGGTNAHAILEEAPPFVREPDDASPVKRVNEILVLSARTETALNNIRNNLAAHINQNKHLVLEDIAFTLQTGRKAFSPYRAMALASSIEDAAERLSTPDSGKLLTAVVTDEEKHVIFMFSGQGSQYVNMGLDLYRTEPVFRDEMDRCFDILQPLLGFDIKAMIYPSAHSPAPDRSDPTNQINQINQTEITQPAIFAFEYALARLLMNWGIQPYAMIGHSIGEYTAACLSGVFSLEDALNIVVRRGKAMQKMPAGAMLSVSLSEDVLKPMLEEPLSLAAVNSSSLCVVSGPIDAIDKFETELTANGTPCRRLHTSHAFHSAMMDPILAEFEDTVKRVRLNPPVIPYISNLTGTWITVEDATRPAYWSRHLRHTVRFADGIRELGKDAAAVFVEVGPGSSLSTFVRRHDDRNNDQNHQPVLNLVRSAQENAQDNMSDTSQLLNQIGRLWLHGVSIDWVSFHDGRQTYRIPLPTYPFDRQRFKADIYTIKPGATLTLKPNVKRNPDMADWFYTPTWNRSRCSAYQPGNIDGSSNWLIFGDDQGLGEKLIKRISGTITRVEKGESFQKTASGFILNPKNESDYERLFNELKTHNKWPDRILHLWGVTGNTQDQQATDSILHSGIYGLIAMARALGQQPSKPVRLDVISDHMHDITGSERVYPLKATLLGPVKIIPQEFSHITCKSIDILLRNETDDLLIDQLLMELSHESAESVIALRGAYRWIPNFEAVRLDRSLEPNPRLNDAGVYLITGGLGGIGIVLAETIAQTVRNPRLVLLGRSAFPQRDEWDHWLFSHYDEDSTSLKIRRIRELEAKGAQVRVMTADVSDPEQMTRVIAAVKEEFGRIHGVIHSAGIPDGGFIQRRTTELTRQVLAPKVSGTILLDRLLADEPLDFFVLCSSENAILAPPGQVAYCAANAFLDAFAHSRANDSRRLTVSINWGTWQETGMAVEAVKKLEGKPTAAPSAGGATALRAIQVNHPMFEKCIVDSPDQATLVSVFDSARDWFVNEHIILDKMALSGTGYLEMARVAFETVEGKRSPMEIRDVFFFSLLVVGEGEKKQVRTVLTRTADGYEFQVKSQVVPGSDQWQLHSTGKIIRLDPQPVVKYDLRELANRCGSEDRLITEADHRTLPHGPRWWSLQKMRIGNNRQFSTLEYPETYAADLDHFGLHPAIFDILITVLDPRFQGFLPFSYKKLNVFGNLTRQVYSYIEFSEANDPTARTIQFAYKIMDGDGQLLMDIESLSFAKISEMASKHADQFFADLTDHHRVHPLLKDGLLSHEGAEVFRRVLCASIPQAVVSAKDFKQAWEEKKTAKPILSEDLGRMLGKSPRGHKRPETGTPYVPPQTELEKRLALMFESFFGFDQYGINDNFFEMGGDSLNAITIANRFHKEFNVELPMAEFYSKPTVKELAQYVMGASKSSFSAITPVEEKEYYILSSAQKRFYLLQQLKQERLWNNIPLVIMMDGPLDKERMKTTFDLMIQRHESLRTSFHMIDDEPVQVVHPNAVLNIEYLEAASEEDLDDQIMGFFKPFNLEKAPLMRIGFVRVTDTLHAMVVDFHHIIADGTMLSIFVREFTAAYSGQPLPALTLQYKDVAEWQDRNKDSEAMQKQEAYWLNEFKTDVSLLRLPRDFEKTAESHFGVGGISFHIDGEDFAVLKTIAADEGATLFMVLLALINIFLHKMTGQQDIVIGSAVAGRRHSDVESIIGLFVNTLAMRHYPSGEKTFPEFLNEVKERTLAAFENQDYQFENLVNRIVGKRDLTQATFIDVIFALQNFGMPELEISGIRISPYQRFRHMTTAFDFDMRAYDMDDHLIMHIDYRTALYKPETMEKWVQYFREIIQAVVADKQIRLQDIRISHHVMEAKSDAFQDFKEDFVF